MCCYFCFTDLVVFYLFFLKYCLSYPDQSAQLLLQIFRGLAYIHNVHGVCHRDIKPQNLLVCCFGVILFRGSDHYTIVILNSFLCVCITQVDTLTHQLKICDFGSAKALVNFLCSAFVLSL